MTARCAAVQLDAAEAATSSADPRRRKMDTDRKVSIIAGMLFIFATTASLLGSSLTGIRVLNAPDYLSHVSSNGNRVIVGALLSFFAAAASSGIAISLYPAVLKRHNEGLALGAIGFRLIEGVFYIVGALCLLSLFTVSQQSIAAGGQDACRLSNDPPLIAHGSRFGGLCFWRIRLLSGRSDVTTLCFINRSSFLAGYPCGGSLRLCCYWQRHY